jgi:hypothetical protein
VVEDLAAGFFRGLLALVHTVARQAIEVFWHAVIETVAEIVGRILLAIFRAIAYVVRLLLFPIEWLYRALLDRVARGVPSPAFAHVIAIAVLMSSGFIIGAGASAIYHLTPGYVRAASLPEQPQ